MVSFFLIVTCDEEVKEGVIYLARGLAFSG